MRITIATRLFLALTLVSVAILTLNAVVTRWNFERGFLEYVAQQEADTITDAASELADVYRIDGSWESLQGNPRRWNDLLRPDGGKPLPERRSGPERRPGKPPPPDPFELGRRISLLDADGEVIVGSARNGESGRSVPILVDEQTVGYVTIAPRRQLTNQVDQNFARKQERSIVLIAVAALLFAAVISAIVAKQLTRPIRALASGARSITAGHYDTRIPATHGDELGDLAGDFNQLAETLEKSRMSRQRWVADIAHELRTPLAILRGELDAIEDGVRAFDTTSRKSLQAEVARLSNLVGDLHDLSIYDDGAFNYHREPVNPGDLLAATLQNTEKRLQDVGITVTSDLADDIEILADEARLQQLFTNLIENTIRYTDSPGTLAVTCAVTNDTVDITFADSTPGVPARALDRLFDRLFRVDNSRNRDSGGSGLGLSICKAIVEAHHGTIGAADSDAGGLLIRVQLPMTDQSGASA
jgi:two-component system sensor histidine kinase BaeS